LHNFGICIFHSAGLKSLTIACRISSTTVRWKYKVLKVHFSTLSAVCNSEMRRNFHPGFSDGFRYFFYVLSFLKVRWGIILPHCIQFYRRSSAGKCDV